MTVAQRPRKAARALAGRREAHVAGHCGRFEGAGKLNWRRASARRQSRRLSAAGATANGARAAAPAFEMTPNKMISFAPS